MRFRIKISDIFTWFSILVCHLVCGFGKMKSPWKSYEGKKVLQREKARSPNDVWKSYLKAWDRWNSQTFKGHYSWTPQESWVGGGGRVTAPDMNPQLHKRSVMAYGHKTQSFMKNGGQQICLGKALLFNFKGKFLNMCQYEGGGLRRKCYPNASQ